MTPATGNTGPSHSVFLEALMAQELITRIAAHDLLSPLGSISGLVHLLRAQAEDDGTDKMREYMDYMDRSVSQMDGLIEAFRRDTARLDTLVQPAPQDMREAVARAIAFVRHAGKPLDINVTGPSWTVNSDPGLLHLLVSHLLRNALQHPHPDRAFDVRITLSRHDKTGRLRVSDTGRGFDPKKRNAIFLPARRNPNTGAPERLGLAICKDICRRYHWQIEAHSDGHSGAAFEVAFPMPV